MPTTKLKAVRSKKPQIGDSVGHDPLGMQDTENGSFRLFEPGVLVAVKGRRAKMFTYSLLGHPAIRDVERRHLFRFPRGGCSLSKKDLAAIRNILDGGRIGSWLFRKKAEECRQTHRKAVAGIIPGLKELLRVYSFGPDIQALLKRHPKAVATYEADVRALYGDILRAQLDLMSLLERLEKR
jgi:hypothetical protein